MERIVECVPNFSEGRDLAKVESITDAIEAVEGVNVIHVDPGAATNRTVVTFVGPPEGIAEAAFRAVEKAAEVIDMREHTGEHPRMGAADVFPFIPVSGVSMDECVEISRDVAERVGRELEIPVYLYENSATTLERRSLAYIRSGEYEGFRTKIKKPGWEPDFGPREFNGKSGCTTMGARQFLIAYNVNLDSDDKDIAQKIAERIRESGAVKRDGDGNIMRDSSGKAIRESGLLRHVRAVGWYIEEYRKAQISINLLNFKKTPLHIVYDTCAAVARELGCSVTGSEVVGLVPMETMTEAGIHYLRKDGKSPGLPQEELVKVARKRMGLDDVAEFDPERKIIELLIRKRGPLGTLGVVDFAKKVSLSDPAPGGGSVAALACCLSAALSCMVANVTARSGRVRENEPELEELHSRAVKLQGSIHELACFIDEDAAAFTSVMAAMRMPRGSGSEKETRIKAIEAAYMRAAEVPMDVIRACEGTLSDLRYMAEHGESAALSDVAVSTLMAGAGIRGAAYNVKINIEEIGDVGFTEKMGDELERALEHSGLAVQDILAIISGRLGYRL